MHSAPRAPLQGSFQVDAWSDLLDANVLFTLSTLDPGGRGGLVLRVLRVFTDSLPRYIDQMEQARQALDTRSANRAAHTVKSSAANVGALFLHSVCATAELRCVKGLEWVDSAEVGTFLAECRRLHQVLSARLGPAPKGLV